MIDRKHELPIKRQAELVGISRGSVYYVPQPASAADLALMRVIDELHLEHPFAGARMLRDMLNARGLPTASVVRSSQATPARRRGQPGAAVSPAELHLSSPDWCSNGWGHL
jgi:putative transposase